MFAQFMLDLCIALGPEYSYIAEFYLEEYPLLEANRARVKEYRDKF
jgi:hypothetical protein